MTRRSAAGADLTVLRGPRSALILFDRGVAGCCPADAVEIAMARMVIEEAGRRVLQAGWRRPLTSAATATTWMTRCPTPDAADVLAALLGVEEGSGAAASRYLHGWRAAA